MSKSVNDVSVGSPSLIRIVRRISFGITTRPRSSILLTLPVAFIYLHLPIDVLLTDDDTPGGLAGSYLRSAECYQKQYDMRGISVVRYDHIDAFVRAYANGGYQENNE